MKVGIFGDSYAARSDWANGFCWAEFLERRYNIDVTNFGVSGSSLWYSYKKFTEEHEKFDKIVFLATGFNRTYIPLPDKYTDDRFRHVTGDLEGFKYIIKDLRDPYLNNVYKAIELYYAYLIDRKKDYAMHNLMLDDIRRKRPDALLIPCFSGNIPGVDYSLTEIHEIDIKYYNLGQEAFRMDRRHCHMNQENNFVMATLIKKWLDTGNFNFNIKMFKNPTKPLEYYFLDQ